MNFGGYTAHIRSYMPTVVDKPLPIPLVHVSPKHALAQKLNQLPKPRAYRPLMAHVKNDRLCYFSHAGLIFHLSSFAAGVPVGE